MRVIFVTHNSLGLACLEELAELDAEIQAVYTRPNREDLSDQSDISKFTKEHDIPLHRVDSVNDDTVKSQISNYNPEVMFVVGWSRLVDTEVIEIPSKTALGMHPAPLPRGRGRAPIAWSLIQGLDETALSFFHLEDEADSGDIVGQVAIPIEANDDAKSIYEKVVKSGRKLIREYYPEFVTGNIPRNTQDESQATWWPKRSPEQGLIDWNRPPWEVYNWIRGQTRPYPGAYSFIGGEQITVWSAKPPEDEIAFVQPGELVYREDDVLGVGVWEGVIELTELQVNDDDPIVAGNFIDEYNFDIGDVFVAARKSDST